MPPRPSTRNNSAYRFIVFDNSRALHDTTTSSALSYKIMIKTWAAPADFPYPHGINGDPQMLSTSGKGDVALSITSVCRNGYRVWAAPKPGLVRFQRRGWELG